MSENKGFDGAETEDAATTSTRPNLVISVQPHSQDSSRVELPVLTRDWQSNPRGQFIPVHGLDFLIGATSLLIQQTVELNDIASKIDSENRYIIRVPNGETLYIGSEASSPRQRCLCGSGRAFVMHLHDNTRQEALVLHRRLASASCMCPCRLQEMKVVMPPGEYVGRVHQQWTWLVPLYLVRGAADEVLYLIEGPARVRRSALQLAEFKDRVRTIKMAKTMHSIENHALKRGDSLSETIMQRIRNVDLVAVQAKYHRTCYDTFRFPTTSISAEGSRKRGRPQCDHTITAMNEIYTFIQSHDEECQFTINDFKGAVSGKCPDDKTIVKKIKEKYGDQVTLSRSLGRPTIFCFGSAFHEVLQDAWYTAKRTDKEEEKLRIVRTAASIILEEIKTTPCDTSQYPPPDRFVESAKDDIPECLYTLLEELIVKNKADNIGAASRKCVVIAHAIIAACQPRSFTSSAKKARV